jgi:ParB family transcriptional regulator, chromosome partitioning protein
MMRGNSEMAILFGGSQADAVKIKLRTEILFLRPDAITPDPDQPRQEFDEPGLARLAASLLKYGQLQPVLVRKEQSRYVIVAGERRWRAAKLAGMANVQALLCKGGDVRSIQLVENLLREDLKPVEQAKAYPAIMDKEGWSARELGRQLSLEHSGITRALKLLTTDVEIQEAVDAGKIPHTTAYEIARQPAEKQVSLARAVVAGTLKGDDLRRKPKPAPVLTLGKPPTCIYEAGKIRLTVTGHRSHEEVVSALEAAVKAARSGKMPLVGGLGRRRPSQPSP